MEGLYHDATIEESNVKKLVIVTEKVEELGDD